MNENLDRLIVFIFVMMPAWVYLVSRRVKVGKTRNVILALMLISYLAYIFTVSKTKNLDTDWIFILAVLVQIGFILFGMYVSWARQSDG